MIAQLELPNGGVDQTSVSGNAVRLLNVGTGQVIEADVSVNNDTETLILDPRARLEFATVYRFEVT